MKAILSVYDKAGLVDFAKPLAELGYELLSTGGTHRELASAGVPVRQISDYTGSPEILDGRVKTLHPKVHGGILARRTLSGDMAQLAQQGIGAIDVVAVNLYPFRQTVAKPGVTLEDALENIDIGGPAMVRAAAKNYPSVVVVVDPADYGWVAQKLREGGVSQEERRKLAAKAFQHVAHYDTLVAEYLRDGEPFPSHLTVAMTRLQELRYGENPHQRGAFYAYDSVRTPREGLGAATQHHGRAMSYTNFLDADGAFNLVCDFAEPAVAIIKHTNPCCLAVGNGGLPGLYERALKEGDPVSAYGGIVSTNRTLDYALADALRQVLSPVTGERMFYEIVIAPDATPDGLAHLKRKSQDLRILTAPMGEPHRVRLDVRFVRGGALVQEADVTAETEFKLTSRRQPTASEMGDLRTAWAVCKHVKSNAITIVKDGVLIGMGPGQPNRVRSAEIACAAAGERARGAVAASDAFLPFPDTLEVCAKAGVTCLVHTGGSIRDEDSVKAADRLGMSLLTSGVRHFRH
ncbi:MAG: bifunctional phosphoribosylaminoimidazolecarboxamide formyltransferase/IMP cyclohydrolase [Chloroflexi bacterium]|nr:bifunctional phosphoribosylaminoimidazolecarboxamide formyltransferase/IMP cyclohydrolase [Chloroflexota bacterium]